MMCTPIAVVTSADNWIQQIQATLSLVAHNWRLKPAVRSVNHSEVLIDPDLLRNLTVHAAFESIDTFLTEIHKNTRMRWDFAHSTLMPTSFVNHTKHCWSPHLNLNFDPRVKSPPPEVTFGASPPLLNLYEQKSMKGIIPSQCYHCQKHCHLFLQATDTKLVVITHRGNFFVLQLSCRPKTEFLTPFVPPFKQEFFFVTVCLFYATSCKNSFSETFLFLPKTKQTPTQQNKPEILWVRGVNNVPCNPYHQTLWKEMGSVLQGRTLGVWEGNKSTNRTCTLLPKSVITLHRFLSSWNPLRLCLRMRNWATAHFATKRKPGWILREEVLLFHGAFPQVFACRESWALETTRMLLLQYQMQESYIVSFVKFCTSQALDCVLIMRSFKPNTWNTTPKNTPIFSPMTRTKPSMSGARIFDAHLHQVVFIFKFRMRTRDLTRKGHGLSFPSVGNGKPAEPTQSKEQALSTTSASLFPLRVWFSSSKICEQWNNAVLECRIKWTWGQKT